MTDAGPRGQITMDAGSGEFRILSDGDWQPLSYNIFTVGLKLEPDSAGVDVQLSGDGLGDFSLAATIDPDAPEKPIDGQFSLQGLDISLFGAFTGLEKLAGEVNGQGKLSGPLMKPSVTGNLALSDGYLVDPRLPVPMDDVGLSIDFKGYSADITGKISSNPRSQTTLDGTVNWEGSPSGKLAIRGKRVPFNLEPYAQLELTPDLTIAFKDGDLSVGGDISVPRGSIEIKGLPPSAISVSDDEVVVGVEKEKPVIRALKMDVTVSVGEDQVTFKAFGVEGDLEGTLRIGNKMDTRGTLQLVNGQYEAYGQELTLRRARLLFVGDLTQPYLDIEAIRTVDTVVAGIRLSGPVQSPTTEVFSSPDMPQSDALSYVILGRAPQSRGDEGQMSKAALSLGLTQASKVTGKLGEEFGIRNLTLEAEGSGDQTSVVASGYLTDELSVRYGVGIFEPITTVALRYDLGKYFYLEAASGLAASLDIFYTRDF
jgi:translocation and assembly module TamB